MKKIYFNVSNGQIEDPNNSYFPRYKAMCRFGKIKEIYTLFSIDAILENGQDWVDHQIKHEYKDWKYYSNLRKELQNFIAQPKFWFKRTNYKEGLTNKFVWIKIY
ncbi:gp452 [Bacillus phage G]|uniref:Gp452 n=1 Tax=Bacillus phage G TaxID=2884420 RepID=G3MAJ3_9CAUD|nr:gp452 [Bacillus phage G]AEO93710.1 gp452 [Bacillus phage G]